jgi:hypothetical protein
MRFGLLYGLPGGHRMKPQKTPMPQFIAKKTGSTSA